MLRLPVALLLALLLALLAVACGKSAPRLGPAVPDVPVQAKPNARLGGLLAQVIERPTVDEARVQVRFAPAEGTQACRLDLILPDGAFLVEGEASVHVDTPDAVQIYWIRFPLDRTLDLVIRACGDTPEGLQATELSLRLVNAPLDEGS